MEVYVLNYNDAGTGGVYTNKKTAREKLWENYVKEVLPYISFSDAESYIKEDIKTLTESDYIVDYGWISSAPFYQDAQPESLGVWVKDVVQYNYVCSACGKHSEYATDFCCNCGKKMEPYHD